MAVDWVALAVTLQGNNDATNLDADTHAEFRKIKEAPPEDVEPLGQSDAEAEEFWRSANEAEVAIAAKIDELGEGTPELDEWLAGLIAMRPVPEEPKPKRARAKRK